MSGIGPARGLWGKLPSRGDFVRAGLPRDFTDPWDAWWQRQLAAFAALAGTPWVEAWLEAPVWRFSLAPGVCGDASVLGLWMPSVDRAGRYFPLTLAAIAAPGWDDAFLDAAEAAGRDAVTADLDPDAVRDRLPPPRDGDLSLASGTVWATAGSPRVPPGERRFAGLPTGTAFADMLDALPGRSDPG